MKVIYDNTKKSEVAKEHSSNLKPNESLEVTNDSYDFSPFINKTIRRPFKANALGDSIAWSSFLVRMYNVTHDVRVNDLREKDKKVMKEIFGFDSNTIHIGKRDYAGIHKIECYNIKFAPALFQWKESKSKTVCYQFDTHLHSGLDKQFAHEHDKDMVLNTLRNRGYKPIELSGDYS